LAAVVAFTLLLGTPVTDAQWWWPPEMSVYPPQPSTQDMVKITMWGEWPDSCIPNGSEIQPPTGNAIYFDLIWGYLPGTCCLTVITPWQRSEQVGPLPVGTYRVYATVLDMFGWPMYGPTYTGSFTVHSAWPRGDMNCDGQTDFKDINPFILALSKPDQYVATYPECPILNGDMNGDGSVDFGDINPFVAALANGPPKLEEYSHSGCRGGPWCDEDVFTLTVQGHTLHVLHSNATYNCCLTDITVSLTVTGNRLRFTEEEVLVTPCFCLCCYEVESTVVNLASGTYVVEYCWDDYETGGPRCHVEEIEVP
jgi:hypothetical protein